MKMSTFILNRVSRVCNESHKIFRSEWLEQSKKKEAEGEGEKNEKNIICEKKSGKTPYNLNIGINQNLFYY